MVNKTLYDAYCKYLLKYNYSKIIEEYYWYKRLISNYQEGKICSLHPRIDNDYIDISYINANAYFNILIDNILYHKTINSKYFNDYLDVKHMLDNISNSIKLSLKKEKENNMKITNTYYDEIISLKYYLDPSNISNDLKEYISTHLSDYLKDIKTNLNTIKFLSGELEAINKIVRKLKLREFNPANANYNLCRETYIFICADLFNIQFNFEKVCDKIRADELMIGISDDMVHELNEFIKDFNIFDIAYIIYHITKNILYNNTLGYLPLSDGTKYIKINMRYLKAYYIYLINILFEMLDVNYYIEDKDDIFNTNKTQNEIDESYNTITGYCKLLNKPDLTTADITSIKANINAVIDNIAKIKFGDIDKKEPKSDIKNIDYNLPLKELISKYTIDDLSVHDKYFKKVVDYARYKNNLNNIYHWIKRININSIYHTAPNIYPISGSKTVSIDKIYNKNIFIIMVKLFMDNITSKYNINDVELANTGINNELYESIKKALSNIKDKDIIKLIDCIINDTKIPNRLEKIYLKAAIDYLYERFEVMYKEISIELLIIREGD